MRQPRFFALFVAALGFTVAVSGQQSTFTPFTTSAGSGGLIPIANIATGTCDSSTFVRGDGTCVAPSGSGDVVGPASSTDNAIARFDATTGKLLQGSVLTIDDAGTLTLLAGTASAPALLIPAGTLMTTPSDGAMEADANAVYGTTDAGNRGYLPVNHVIRADATPDDGRRCRRLHWLVFRVPTHRLDDGRERRRVAVIGRHMARNLT